MAPRINGKINTYYGEVYIIDHWKEYDDSGDTWTAYSGRVIEPSNSYPGYKVNKNEIVCFNEFEII